MSSQRSKFTVKFKNGKFEQTDIWRKRVNNPQKALKKIGELMTINNTQRFDKEVTPDGKKWQNLAPSTVKRRKTSGGRSSSKKLQDSGNLRKSLKNVKIKKAPKVHRTYTVNIEANLPYASIQQNSLMKHAKTPLKYSRRYLGHAVGDRRSYNRILNRYILTGKV